MNSVVMELTGREKEILDEAAAKVEEEMACLSALSREQRLARFQERQYPVSAKYRFEGAGRKRTRAAKAALASEKGCVMSDRLSQQLTYGLD